MKKMKKNFLHLKSKKFGTKTFASKNQNKKEIKKKKKTPLPGELGAAGEA